MPAVLVGDGGGRGWWRTDLCADSRSSVLRGETESACILQAPQVHPQAPLQAPSAGKTLAAHFPGDMLPSALGEQLQSLRFQAQP